MENVYGLNMIGGFEKLVRQANEMQSLFNRMNISTSQLQQNAEQMRKSSIYFSAPYINELKKFNQTLNLPNTRIFSQVHGLSRLFNSSQWYMASSFLQFNSLSNKSVSTEKIVSKIESNDDSLKKPLINLKHAIGAPEEQPTPEQEKNIDTIYFAINELQDGNDYVLTNNSSYDTKQYKEFIWAKIKEYHKFYRDNCIPYMEEVNTTIDFSVRIIALVTVIYALLEYLN